jgi:transcription elongation GreA/GreB family factor
VELLGKLLDVLAEVDRSVSLAAAERTRLRQRKRPLDPAFTAPILDALAAQARASGTEALAAALAVQSAAELGVEPPPGGCPAPEEVLAAAREPCQAVAAVGDPALWPAALDALAARPDADGQFRRLLELAPAEHLDDVAARLRQAGAGEAVAAAAARAAAEPSAHRELLLCLWRGPPEAVPGAPGPVELLGKLLDVLAEVDRSVSLAAAERTRLRQRIRAAFAARDYACCRRAVGEMDEAVAETYRDRIGRCGGLAQTVREEMLGVLRERFGGLFVQAPVEPWRDERTLWTTQAALHRREELLKEIVEVKMPANARAIGAAAAHGDLSENSEWKFAIEERDLLRARAAKLQDEIARARVLTAEDVPGEQVGIGSRIRLRRQDDGREVTVTVLGAWDTDLERNVFSYKAAVSEELLGKGVGDPVALKLEGLEGQYRIAELGCGVE